MTADEIRAFVKRRTASLRAQDPATLAADYAEDGILETPSTGTHRGRRAIQEHYEQWNTSFPSSELTVNTVIAENDQAAVFFKVAGTHQGDFLGLPATGKRIEFQGVLLQRFENNQIVHERRIYDFSGLLIKLGILKVKLGH